METKPDTRYCYGACCTWHGPIQNTINSSGIPGCPHCGGPLFEMKSKEEWNARAEEFQDIHSLSFYTKWLELLNKYTCKPLKGWNWEEDYLKFVEEIPKDGN